MQLTSRHAAELRAQHGGPLYVYCSATLQARAQQLVSLKAPFGLTVRYAIKANPHPEIITLCAAEGLHFDASSSYEAAYLLSQGVTGDTISLSSQQPAHNLSELVAAGVRYVATSLHQLALFADAAPHGARVALRVNAGMGSGHNKRNTTAGVGASFGIWHEYLEDALHLATHNHLIVDRLHTHIGSGADPAVWEQAIDTSLAIVERMPDVTTLDIGGGYKVRRMPNEPETNIRQVMEVFNERLRAFAARTGRQLHLEIEPGTWLVAPAGTLLAEVIDIVDTGADGFTFLRTNTGMNDFLRPTLYGARHHMRILNDAVEQQAYAVVGHNCESSDILTTAPGEPEVIEPRLLNKAAIGDILAIEDTGAYCAAMRAKGYNSFPIAKEIML